MGKIIGIDLGTTNSVVAVMEGGTANCNFNR
jgi:molecular chaperone DnaK (HSP70)